MNSFDDIQSDEFDPRDYYHSADLEGFDDDYDDDFDPHERDPYYSEYTDDGYYDEVDFY